MTMYALKKTLKTNDMSLESTATTAWTNTVAELNVLLVITYPDESYCQHGTYISISTQRNHPFAKEVVATGF